MYSEKSAFKRLTRKYVVIEGRIAIRTVRHKNVYYVVIVSDQLTHVTYLYVSVEAHPYAPAYNGKQHVNHYCLSIALFAVNTACLFISRQK